MKTPIPPNRSIVEFPVHHSKRGFGPPRRVSVMLNVIYTPEPKLDEVAIHRDEESGNVHTVAITVYDNTITP